MPAGPSSQLAGTVFFPGFRFDPASGRLWRDDDEEVQLRPKTAAVLGHLLRHAGDVVSKQALLEAVWPDAFVGDAVLTVSINELRQALADDSRSPAYIATAHRRGYRFVATVTSSPPAPPDGPETVPLVGRDAELAALDGWWEKARHGQRQVVFVTAQAGVGKTALVDAFVERCREHQPLLVGRGQCVEQFGEGEAYLPLLDALSGLGRGDGGHHVRDVLQSTAPLWLLQLPGLVPPDELESLQLRTAGASAPRMLRELGDALDVLSAERPILLVCEDLHLSDRSTTEVLAYLARRREPARLMIVGTYRPAEAFARSHPVRQVVRELRAHNQCGFLALELLTRPAVAAYLRHRLAPRTPSDALITDLHQRTDGNALFVTTVVDYLLDRGLLTDVGGEVATVEPLDRLGIPDSVGQFIERQLDELDPVNRRLLEVAAAVGVDFSAEAVHAGVDGLDGLEAADVADRCSALAGEGGLLVERDVCVWPDGTVTAQFRFRHGLYHEVLYGDLPPARRVSTHRRIGDRLAAGYAARAGDIAAELAMHFERGHEGERAIPFLARAAETALRRAAHHEAQDYASRGLELLARTPGIADRAAVELRLRMMHTVALVTLQGAGAPAVDEGYRRARAVCAQIDDAKLLGPVLYGLWNYSFNRGQMSDAAELSDELRRLADRHPDPVLELMAHATAGFGQVLSGRPADALPNLEQGIRLYDDAAHRQIALEYGEDPGVGCQQWASYASWLLGCPDRARRHAEEARRLAEELGHPNDLAQATWFGIAVNIFCRDLDRVAVLDDALIEVCDRYDLTRWGALGRVVQGWVAAQRGDPHGAIAPMRQGLEDYAGASGYPYFSTSLLAETLALAGDAAAALELASAALATARRNGELWYESELVRFRGEMLLRVGTEDGVADDVVEAERSLLEARDIARRQQARSLELRAVTSLARLWSYQDRAEDGREQLAEIAGWFTEGHDTHDLRAARSLLDELA